MTEGQPSTPVLMFVAHRHAEARITAFLEEEGFPVTPAQARVAARVGPDGVRLTTLAEQAQVTKQTAGFLVDQLERAGYVERVADPADARARLVRLAPRGAEAQRRAREVEAAIEAQWEAHLGPERFAALRAALVDLRALTDPWA